MVACISESTCSSCPQLLTSLGCWMITCENCDNVTVTANTFSSCSTRSRISTLYTCPSSTQTDTLIQCLCLLLLTCLLKLTIHCLKDYLVMNRMCFRRYYRKSQAMVTTCAIVTITDIINKKVYRSTLTTDHFSPECYSDSYWLTYLSWFYYSASA